MEPRMRLGKLTFVHNNRWSVHTSSALSGSEFSAWFLSSKPLLAHASSNGPLFPKISGIYILLLTADEHPHSYWKGLYLQNVGPCVLALATLCNFPLLFFLSCVINHVHPQYIRLAERLKTPIWNSLTNHLNTYLMIVFLFQSLACHSAAIFRHPCPTRDFNMDANTCCLLVAVGSGSALQYGTL